MVMMDFPTAGCEETMRVACLYRRPSTIDSCAIVSERRVLRAEPVSGGLRDIVDYIKGL